MRMVRVREKNIVNWKQCKQADKIPQNGESDMEDETF